MILKILWDESISIGALTSNLSGTGDSQRDSHESIRDESFAIETPIFIARQADSHEPLEFPIRANHPIRANRANRFARITPLSLQLPTVKTEAQNEQIIGIYLCSSVNPDGLSSWEASMIHKTLLYTSTGLV